MSAAEDDTELRDLLIQNLENNGDVILSRSPVPAGRLVASLIVDFLQVFNLDFTLAVFQPEINSINGLDGRDQVCGELGISDTDLNRKTPLLLELVRRGRHRDKAASLPEELTQKQITNARKKFDFYDKEHSGSVLREDLKNVFTDLFPTVSRNMLEKFITDELRASEKHFSTKVDFQLFLGMYRRLFAQCRAVVRLSSWFVIMFDELIKGDCQQKEEVSADRRDHLDLDLEGEEDLDEGDSFFDDPLPKPQKTYVIHSVPSDDEVEYDDDFNSHRSDLSKSELSIGEEIEEVSIEGPDHSGKFDESTQDLSVSQLSQSHGADYMEDVP
uniref:Centrosomal protein 43 n=1 Tax=Amphilophus citrinellus TaxID=61819 RepID=A0A3Q0S158_AMPCI